VYIDLDNVGYFVTGDPTTMTDASGDYTLTGLAAGSYIVSPGACPWATFRRPRQMATVTRDRLRRQTLSAENFGDKAQAAEALYPST